VPPFFSIPSSYILHSRIPTNCKQRSLEFFPQLPGTSNVLSRKVLHDVTTVRYLDFFVLLLNYETYEMEFEFGVSYRTNKIHRLNSQKRTLYLEHFLFLQWRGLSAGFGETN
jgi:hypothetical protein